MVLAGGRHRTAADDDDDDNDNDYMQGRGDSFVPRHPYPPGYLLVQDKSLIQS